jgi:putative DNA primase/helicase
LRIWASGSEQGTSLYLDRKKVQGYGVRFAGDVLLVPLLDVDGKLWNVQRVHTSGDKFFLKDGKVSGCFHLIGDPATSDWLLIAEGYATATTLHQATGYAVAVAFNAGNVKHVVKALRRRHPAARIMLCADDDRETEQKTGKNPGIVAATEAAAAIGAHWCKPSSLPAGGTDFNDLFLAAGVAVVNEQLQAAIAAAAHESADVCTTTAKPKDATRKASAAEKKNFEQFQ